MTNRRMPTANQSRQREIRVFISSTFRDMQEEREELVKQTRTYSTLLRNRCTLYCAPVPETCP